MSQPPPFDPSIPMLTEVFSDSNGTPVAKSYAQGPAPTMVAPVPMAAPLRSQPPAAVEAAPAPEAPPRVQQDEVNADLEARAIATWTEPEWNLLERRLSERILQQMQGRVDFVLEQRLRDCMEDVLKHAIAGLTTELHAGLQKTIESIVVRAVAQELTHLQTLKR